MSGGTSVNTNLGSSAGFRNPDAYEQLMGRWSRRFAPTLIRFGGLADGDRVLDVGCGPGSLLFTVPEVANVASAVGIDPAAAYVVGAQARNTDPRISVQEGDARALPFGDGAFERVYSMFVLMFIPDAERAVAEMVRVTRKGGTVTSATWDGFGSLLPIRLIWNAAVALDPSFVPTIIRPFARPEEMATAWRAAGLADVEETSFLIRQEFSDFDDFWQATTGEGPGLLFVEGLSGADRAKVIEHVRRAYCANLPDGPRSFACTALACRGTVPD